MLQKSGSTLEMRKLTVLKQLNAKGRRSAGSAMLLLSPPKSCPDVQGVRKPGTVGRSARGRTGTGTGNGVGERRGRGKYSSHT